MSNIELRHVHYEYAVGGVKDTSFIIPQGKVACLLGPSGSGKTTILKLIAGFLQPQKGSIWLDSECIADQKHMLSPQSRHIGLVFQQHALFPHLTISENILFGCRHKNTIERKSILNKLLNDFGIAKHEERYPHQISGGEQQRVALARAIAAEPRLLLMDEPFSSLDNQMRQQIQQQCLEIIHKRNLTTLMVTHDEQDAKNMGDMIIRLHANRIETA
jgi:iron(III) transport system ATP-binding protein